MDHQTSGNDWSLHLQEGLDEDVSGSPQPRSLFQVSTARQAPMLKYLEEQMAGFEAEHQARITDIRKYYVLPAHSSVMPFLDGHRAIPQLLLLAVPNLKHCFGDDPILALRAPIDEFDLQTLYAVVMWAGTAPEARKALQRFDESWWITNSRQALGCLIFTYELV